MMELSVWDFETEQEAYDFIKKNIPEDYSFLLLAKGRYSLDEYIVAVDDWDLDKYFQRLISDNAEDPDRFLGNYEFYEYMEIEDKNKPIGKDELYFTDEITFRKLYPYVEYEYHISFD